MRRIGRYQVIKELGRGAMGVVYRCSDPNIGREVAVKIIRMAGGENTEVLNRHRERLFREARSAGALNHPNIVTVYDIGEEERVAYIAMELVEGTTLESLLNEDNALAPERALRILRETAEGLDYAHRKGIVHRDIKPANIMVDESDRVRITDFGIAKVSASEQMTQTGLIMGTPNYMSPEQVQGKPVTGAADQYSLAVIAYEILTGERPFLADQLPTLVYKIVCEEPVPPQHLNPSLGNSIDAVIRQGLGKSAEERYPSCTEFVAALQSACNATPGWRSIPRGGLNLLPTLATPVPDPPSTQRKRIVLPPPVKRETTPPAPPETQSKRRSRDLLPAMFVLLVITVGAAAGAWYWMRRQPAVEETTIAVATPVEAPPATTPPVETEPAKPAETPPPQPPERPPDAQVPEPKPTAPATTSGQRPPPAPLEREIAVRTDPPGARVIMDGKPETACTTPCSVHADAGPHSILVRLEGYAMVRRNFFVSDEPVELGTIALAHATGVVYLRSDPAGASIIIDDKPHPQKTPAQLTLPVGSHKITVQLGGVEASHNVQVSEGEIKQISVTLPR